MKKTILLMLLAALIVGVIFFIFVQNSQHSDTETEKNTDILLVRINDFQQETLLILQKKLQQAFPGVEVRISESVLAISNELINKERRQYDSADVLNYINQSFPNRPSTQIVIGVTEEDIYSGNLNFVFSSGDRTNKVGIISTAYFGREIQVPSDQSSSFNLTTHVENTINNRAHKTALRLIGGIVGLGSNRLEGSDCAMSFSNTLPELDEKGIKWCGDDTQKLETAGLLN